jgi:hypothetical protein
MLSIFFVLVAGVAAMGVPSDAQPLAIGDQSNLDARMNLNWRTGTRLQQPVLAAQTSIAQPVFRTRLQQPVLVAQPSVAQSVFRTRLQQLKPLIAQRLVEQPRFRTLLPRARVLQPRYHSIAKSVDMDNEVLSSLLIVQ